MKHDAIVEQGIPIHERVPIPDDLIPEDSRVEIDASRSSPLSQMSNLSYELGYLLRDCEFAGLSQRFSFPEPMHSSSADRSTTYRDPCGIL